MTRRVKILNLSLLAAIVSSIVFQSLHSFEHLIAEFTHPKCHHSHDTGKDQITHQHHDFDHCFACEFSFSNFVAPEIFTLCSIHLPLYRPYSVAASEQPQVFCGTSYALRGPPRFVV